MSEVTLLPWSVVVIGRWNSSILTPANIAQKLLELPENEQIHVEIPINVAAPPRIRRNGVAISVDEHQLFIEVDRGNYDALAVALNAAAKAVEWLHHTPLQAAGVTVTFSIPDVTQDAPTGTNKKWDDSLAEGCYTISRHIAGRAIQWEDNRILVVADRGEDASSMVIVNFERRSDKKDELKKLLERPVTEFKKHIDAMLAHLKSGGVS